MEMVTSDGRVRFVMVDATSLGEHPAWPEGLERGLAVFEVGPEEDRLWVLSADDLADILREVIARERAAEVAAATAAEAEAEAEESAAEDEDDGSGRLLGAGDCPNCHREDVELYDWQGMAICHDCVVLGQAGRFL